MRSEDENGNIRDVVHFYNKRIFYERFQNF